jgi:hypothetical protein
MTTSILAIENQAQEILPASSAARDIRVIASVIEISQPLEVWLKINDQTIVRRLIDEGVTSIDWIDYFPFEVKYNYPLVLQNQAVWVQLSRLLTGDEKFSVYLAYSEPQSNGGSGNDESTSIDLSPVLTKLDSLIQWQNPIGKEFLVNANSLSTSLSDSNWYLSRISDFFYAWSSDLGSKVGSLVLNIGELNQSISFLAQGAFVTAAAAQTVQIEDSATGEPLISSHMFSLINANVGSYVGIKLDTSTHAGVNARLRFTNSLSTQTLRVGSSIAVI